VAVVIILIYQFSARGSKNRENYDTPPPSTVEYIEGDPSPNDTIIISSDSDIEMIPHDDASNIYSAI
jgi:hypothetical protein